MPKVTIDGIEIEVPDGTTILNAARMIGGKIVPPAMCYYSKLKTTGGYCRTCMVKVVQGSAKDPRPMPKCWKPAKGLWNSCLSITRSIALSAIRLGNVSYRI